MEARGSGFVLKSIHEIETRIWKSNPLRGKTYHKLPDWVIRKKAVINVKNSDSCCFKWAVLAALHAQEHSRFSNEVSLYRKYEQLYDFSGLTFPVAINKIDIFEKKNDVSINVYGLETKEHQGNFVYCVCFEDNKERKKETSYQSIVNRKKSMSTLFNNF